jgi:hypothetical protein
VAGWTTISRADGVAEAELVRMRLEAGGVTALVRDSNTVRMSPILSNVMGGLRIDVPASQEKLAREILGQGPSARHPSGVAEQTADSCPSCGSRDLVHGSRNRARRLWGAVLALFATGAGIPRGLNQERRCRACGEFVPNESGFTE